MRQSLRRLTAPRNSARPIPPRPGSTTPAVAAVAARTDCEVILPTATVQSVFQVAELPVHTIYNSGGWGVMT